MRSRMVSGRAAIQHGRAGLLDRDLSCRGRDERLERAPKTGDEQIGAWFQQRAPVLRSTQSEREQRPPVGSVVNNHARADLRGKSTASDATTAKGLRV
jgi:hypothetical protein